MIIRTEFNSPKHLEATKRVSKLMAWVNLDIRKTSKYPFCQGGTIYINEKLGENVEWWTGELVHEAAHIWVDPMCWFYAAAGISSIAAELPKKTRTQCIELANLASDSIVETRLAANPTLSSYRAKSIDYAFDEAKKNDSMTPTTSELFGILSRLHPTKFEWNSELYAPIQQVIRTRALRNDRYVEIAKLFEPLLDKEVEEKRRNLTLNTPSSFTLGEFAIKPSAEEFMQSIEDTYRSARNASDARSKLGTLYAAGGLGANSDGRTLSDAEHLLRFFEAQAAKFALSIDFPCKQKPKAGKMGTRLWHLQDGVTRINLKRTYMKSGINIPLVTTRTDRVFPFLGTKERTSPTDLVISIDTSSSTGKPEGNMDTAADYEVVLFFSLIKLVQKTKQKLGLTLWSTRVTFTTLPSTFDGTKADSLKKECLKHFGVDDTRIEFALNQIRDNPEKLFFVFTDGEVNGRDLFEVENALFFLVLPKPDNVKMFLDKYGKERVTVIDKLANLPRIVISKWISTYMKHQL